MIPALRSFLSSTAGACWGPEDQRAQTRRLAGSRAQARLGAFVRRREGRVPGGASGRPGCRTPRGRTGTSRFAPPTPSTSPASTRRRRRSPRCARRSGGSRTSSGCRPGWLEGLKLHAATLPLAEFAAVVGNLRAARFGRDSAWRTAALLGALDELRHTQIPLAADARAGALGSAVRLDAQALPHEQLGRDRRAPPVRRAAARVRPDRVRDRDQLRVRDRLHEPAVRRPLGARARRRRPDVREDGDEHPDRRGAPRADRRARARDRGEHDRALRAVPGRQVVLAELAALRGRDRLRDGLPDAARAPAGSFKEFMQEWVLDQFLQLARGVRAGTPWYWDTFSRRSTTTTTWSTRAPTPTARRSGSTSSCPGRRSAPGCGEKYPASWPDFDPIWERITERWRAADPGNDFAVHGTAIVTFCDLCQLVLSNGTPRANTANVLDHGGQRYIFCSEPVPLDLRAGARALRRAQGRREARARRRGARQPDRAGAALLRARLRDLGQRAFRRRLSLARQAARR